MTSKSKQTQSLPGKSRRAGVTPVEPAEITVIHYDDTRQEEFSGTDEIPRLLKEPGVTWVNVVGLHDEKAVQRLGSMFDIHPLVQEDILDRKHRPKVEDMDERLFLVIRTLGIEPRTDNILSGQISVIIGQNYLISFQDQKDELSAEMRRRLAVEQGRLRRSGPDFLAYCVLDTVVDGYLRVLDILDERIEPLDEQAVTKPARSTLTEIHVLKRQMVGIRKSVSPMREVINLLLDGQWPLITESALPYLRDVYDHTIRCNERIETFRDILAGVLDIYLSSNSYRLNEIMKVLTIIATIFIPLTFLSGWYGMNFKYMPELQWEYGYAMVIAIAISIVTVLLVYFRRKQWW